MDPSLQLLGHLDDLAEQAKLAGLIEEAVDSWLHHIREGGQPARDAVKLEELIKWAVAEQLRRLAMNALLVE